MKWPAVLVVAGLLLVGCGSAASSSSTPASGGSSSSSTPASGGSSGSSTSSSGGSSGSSRGLSNTTLFPITVGNAWIYTDTLEGGPSGTTTNMITAVTPDSGGRKVTIKTHSDIPGLPASPTLLTYQFNSDGSIEVPYAQIGSNSVIVKSGGIVWPPRAELASGQSRTSALTLQIKLVGHAITTHARVTVKGAGTQSVTVPAGTYQATQIVETITEQAAGLAVSIEVQTWLAPGVGPVKSIATTTSAGNTESVNTEVLNAFIKG